MLHEKLSIQQIIGDFIRYKPMYLLNSFIHKVWNIVTLIHLTWEPIKHQKRQQSLLQPPLEEYVSSSSICKIIVAIIYFFKEERKVNKKKKKKKGTCRTMVCAELLQFIASVIYLYLQLEYLSEVITRKEGNQWYDRLLIVSTCPRFASRKWRAL